MISAINIALTGLESATTRLNASAANIANLQSAGSLDGTGQAPYTPVTTVQKTIEGGGVVTNVVPKNDPYIPVYSPDSPFANSEGIIGLPNTDLAEEAVNLIIAKATYKANLAVIKASEDMSKELFRALDEKI